MTNYILNRLKQALLLRLFLFTTATTFLFSCSHKIAFNSSVVVPAAQGSIKVKKDNNSNYKVDLDVTNLAPSERLQPPRKTYVVWIETENKGVKNIGQLNSESGWFSKTLKAELHTTTPYKPIRLFITAEDNTSPVYPGAIVVLSTDRFN